MPSATPTTDRIDGKSFSQARGLTLSGDDLNWVRSDKPLFTAGEASPSGRNIWYTELIYAKDHYFYYFEMGNGAETELFMARFGPELFAD